MFFVRKRKKKTAVPAVPPQAAAKESDKSTVSMNVLPMDSAVEPAENEIAAAYKARGNKPALHEGPVYKRRDGIFCQSCGKKLPLPHTGPCIFGKNYCENCYSILADSTTVPCAHCGKPVPYRTIVSELCPDCWLQEIDARRSFYRYYRKLLEATLKERGVNVLPESLEGSNIDGTVVMPVVIRYPWLDVLPLRNTIRDGNERVLYTVSCQGALFAMLSNGIALRYLFLPDTPGFQRWAEAFLCDIPHSYVTAICSDGEDLYIADQNGTVWSSAPMFQRFTLFDTREEIRRICGLLPKEQVQAITDPYRTGIHHLNDFYYDGDHKKFFYIHADGNYYHGYDVRYLTVSKSELFSRRPSLNRTFYDLYVQCLGGNVPLFAIAELLEEDETLTDYQPPEDTGRGIDWS